MNTPTVIEAATAIAAVCGAVVGIAAAAAVIVRLGRWAYAEVDRRHRLDAVVALGPALEQVAYQLSPNSGESLFDQITHVSKVALPELVERVVPIEAYVEELKERELRGRIPTQRPFREPPPKEL